MQQQSSSQNQSQSLSSKKGFLVDTLKLGSGTAIGQLVLILSMPVLSRIFTPEQFGVTSLFLAFVLISSRISGFRYEMAIMLPRQNSHAKVLFVLVTLITIVFSIIVGLLLWLFRDSIAAMLKTPQLSKYLFLTGPAIFIYGMVNTVNYWNTRRKKYKLLALGRLCNNSGSTAFQLGGGLAGFASSGILISGLVLGKIIELIIIGYNSILPIFKTLPSQSFKKMIILAKRYKKFPQFNIWSILINNLSWYVPSFLLAFFFSSKIVGWYAIGERTIRAPMNFIGLAISQVFFQRGSEANRLNNLDNLYSDTVGMLSRIGLLPTIILTMLGKDIFVIFLGPDWAEAGVYVQILGLWAFIWFITSPVSTIISILEKQEKGLLFNSIIFISRIVALLVGGLLKSPRIAIMLLGITGIFSYGTLLLWIGLKVNVSITKTMSLIFNKTWTWSIFTLFILVILKHYQMTSIITIIVSILILMIYYYSLFQKNNKIFNFIN